MNRTTKTALLAVNIPTTLFLIFVLALYHQNEEFEVTHTNTFHEASTPFAEKEVLEGKRKRIIFVYE